MKTVVLATDAAILRFIASTRDPNASERLIAMLPARDPSGRVVGLYALTHPTRADEDTGWSMAELELWRAARAVSHQVTRD